MSKLYTFREITEKDELEEFFRLRYEVYLASPNKVFIKENKNRIDIDYFDIHSTHYSLTVADNNVGYIRIVLPKDELTNQTVLDIGKQYNLLDEEEYFRQNGKAPFPFLSYNGVPKSHWNYYNELLAKSEGLAEASRLILNPNFRTIRNSKFLVECAIVIYILICIGRKHAVINCLHEHAGFYEHYGFLPIANRQGYILNGMNRECLSLPLFLSLSLSSIPKHFHAKFERMTEEFKATKKIVREL